MKVLLCHRHSIYLAVTAFLFAFLFVLHAIEGAHFKKGDSVSTPKKIIIKDVPHIRQKPDFCGEACVAMALSHYGFKIDQDHVFDRSGLNPEEGRGCYTPELYRAFRNLGIKTPSPWVRLPTSAKVRRAALERELNNIKKSLSKGEMVIVCCHYDESPDAPEHFRLIVGYDDEKKEIVYHEPAVSNGAYQRMPYDVFLRILPLGLKAKKPFLVRFLFEDTKKVGIPTRLPELSNADYAQKIIALKKQVGKEFRIAIEKPFVVTGDLDEAWFDRCRMGTIRWAVQFLYKDYFDKPLGKLITIYLFKDKESYEKHAWNFFQHRPHTPFGYYSSEYDALVMNIATGGGTLVHEIVHPLLERNFPSVPAWFNEGLASLYEQCTEHNGHITGLLNWRLPILQKGIKEGDFVPLKQLMSTTRDEFYLDARDMHYAEARYLLYYVQEKGLLRKYYKEFKKNCKINPTGIKTLSRLLKKRSIEEVEEEWLEFVKKLKR